MKDNNKKILKGITVGALACTAMLGLTGCSTGVSIGQQEYDRIMAVIEKTENILPNEDATYVFNKAMAKALYTESDFWNNMEVECSVATYDNENKLIYSKFEKYYSLKHNNNYVFMCKTPSKIDTYDSNGYYVLYTDYSQGSYKLTTFSKNANYNSAYKKTVENPKYFDACINSGVFMDLGLGMGEDSDFEFFKASDIAGGRKNDAENYVVTITNYWYGIETTASQTETIKIEYEIDGDYNILSINMQQESTYDGGLRGNATILFNYGKISYANISNEMNIILSAPEST